MSADFHVLRGRIALGGGWGCAVNTLFEQSILKYILEKVIDKYILKNINPMFGSWRCLPNNQGCNSTM